MALSLLVANKYDACVPFHTFSSTFANDASWKVGAGGGGVVNIGKFSPYCRN